MLLEKKELIMITNYNLKYQNQVLDLILQKNQKDTSVRYFPNNKNEVLKRLQKRVSQDDVFVLVDIVDEKVLGYLELLIDETQNYLQLLAHFAYGDYQNSLGNYFDYIYKNYKAFSFHYVLSDHNTEEIKFMNTTSATHDGFEVMMHVFKEDYVYEENQSITRLNDQYKKDFCTLHNQLNQDAYWTGELLLESNKFDIFMKIKNEKLIGYIAVSHYGNHEEEVYFIYGDSIETKKELYHKGLNHRFETAKSIQVLLDQKENSEIPYLMEMGFQEKERIITFYIDAI
jgi:hypothetical protein